MTPDLDQEFQGKVAVVTGGSLGIGRAVAERLAAGGAAVALCGIDPRPVRDAEAALRAAGFVATGSVLDVADGGQVAEWVAATAERYGGVDVVVTSAGIQRYGNVVDTDEELWDRVLDVNLKGVFLACKYAIPELRRRGGGTIVNVSSVQAFAAQDRVAAYCASKGGINALSRAMAMDHAHENIRVNVVCPGSVDTPMLRWAVGLTAAGRQLDDIIADLGRTHPLGRVATPAEVAEMVAFLAGPRSSFCTGGEYRVDGGLLALNPAVGPYRAED